MSGVIRGGVLAAAVVVGAALAPARAGQAAGGAGVRTGGCGVGVVQSPSGPQDASCPPPCGTGRRLAGDLKARLDVERRLACHECFLREAAAESGPRVEVVLDVEEVRRSLRFLAEAGARAGAKTSAAVARVFARTEDEEARRLCLAALYRINNERAKRELPLAARDHRVEARWREVSACLLRVAVSGRQRIRAAGAKAAAALGPAVGR